MDHDEHDSDAQMTPDEMRSILAKFDRSQEWLALRTGRNYSRIRRMARGGEPIDDALAAWLRAYAAATSNDRRKLPRPAPAPVRVKPQDTADYDQGMDILDRIG
jgi:hypothetical protein